MSELSSYTAQEITVATAIGDLGGILYGQADKPIILALHGWLDNAASFQLLAPMLDDYALLALDLPGHGHSAWLGKGSSYLIWSYVPAILEAIENHPLLNQQPFYILGHSLGTGIAMLIASVIPEKILGYIALDSLGPITTPTQQAAAQLKQALLAKEKQSSSYATVELALAVRLRANTDIAEPSLKNIVARNLIKTEEGWQWSTDPRLRLPSIVRFTEEQLENIMQSLRVPVLAIHAAQGMASRAFFEGRMKHIKNIRLVTVEGQHHFHLQPKTASQIAAHIKEFITDDK